MGENLIKVVIDTNILISAFGFGGKPRQVLLLAAHKNIQGIISEILIAELSEVINKKFPRLIPDLPKIKVLVKKNL